MSSETTVAVDSAAGVAAGLAALLSAEAENTTDHLPPQVLRVAAPFAVLLVRRAVLLSSVLAPPVDRIPTAEPAIALLGTCCDAAVVAGDQGLAQLLDWACLAWTGSRHNGCFFAGRHLPDQVHARLLALLDQTRRPMLVATGELVLEARIRQLEESVERHSTVDRVFCRTLLLEPVAAVIAGLRMEPTDGGLLEQSGEELVARANATMERRIPPNGRRWPLLVRAADAVRAQVRELLDIAELLDAPAPEVSGISLEEIDPALGAVLSAALLTDSDLAAPKTEAGDPVLTVYTQLALEAIGAPESPAAFRLASLAAAADVGTAVSRAVLKPFHALAEHVDELLTRLPEGSDGTVAESHELVADALVRGALADARAAADLLESECNRIMLNARADTLERAALRLTDHKSVDDKSAVSIRRYVKVARERAESGEFDEAQGFLADGEVLAASAEAGMTGEANTTGDGKRSGPSRGRSGQPSAGSAPWPVTFRGRPLLERSTEARTRLELPGPGSDLADESAAKRLYEAGRADEAEVRLRRLLHQDPKNPGVYLLLRIYREQNRLKPAIDLIGQLTAAGVTTWRHHVELGRNAISAGELDVARDQLRIAERAGADPTWLNPLLRSLREVQSQVGEARPSAPASRTHEQNEDTILRLRAGELDQADWWEVIESDVAAGRLDRALALTEQARVVRWAPGVLVRVLHTSDGVRLDDSQTHKLTELVRSSRDEPALLILADLLVTADRAADALAVLDVAEDTVAPGLLPRLWFIRTRALREVGRDDEAEELRRRTRPPLPGDTAEEPLGEPDPRTVPECHWPASLSGTVGTEPLIREGQLRLDRGDVSGAATCWADAVRAQHHTIALPAALAALVTAGRPEEALQLYADLADTLWVGAGAAWNLGCAYAATGRRESAAACFEYSARIATRTYTPEQAVALRALFDVVGRPLPTLARSFRSVGGGPVSGGLQQVQRALADADLYRDVNSFVLAGNTIRAALRAATPDQQHRLLAEVERLFGQLAAPDAMAAAELVRTLASGGRAEQAWSTVLKWIERSDAAPSLLAPAVQLARDLDGAQDRIRLLRERLESRQEGAGFELYLSLAKLAGWQEDPQAHHRYAARALAINPACAEAAKMLTSEAITRTPAALAALVDQTRQSGCPPEEVAERLSADFGPLVDALRMDAVQLLSADVDPDQARHELPLDELPTVDTALLAAEDGDWESAARHFRTALDRKPRHLGLAAATAAAFIRIGSLGTARAIALTVEYSTHGQEMLARVAFAAGDYPTAALHLAERAHRRFRSSQILGHAGLLLHFLDRPDEAIQVLLASAHRRLPGIPHLHAALAAILAHRYGEDGLRVEAVQMLLADRLDSAAVVRWVIKYDSLEALNEPDAPRLRATDLQALVRHFDPDQRDRLRRFLSVKRHTFSLRELALLEERDGRMPAAFEVRWAMVQHGSRDQLTLLRELLRFCERVGYREGYRRALDFKRELGQSVTPEEQRRLESWQDSEKYRVDQLADDIKAALYEIQQLDLTSQITTIRDVLARLSDRLIALTEGTSDEAVVHEVSALWARIVEFLTGQAAGTTDTPDPAESARAFATARSLQGGLGSKMAAQAMQAVSVRLYREWEQVSRRSHEHEMDPVDLTVVTAHRLPGGPAELIVRLTARAAISELQIEAGNESTPVQLPVGIAQDVPLVIESAVAQTEVVLSYLGPVGQVRKPYPIQVPVRSPESAQFDHRFSPNSPAGPAMFVGREKERALLRMSYQGVVDSAVSLRFLEGPREVGKSSLALSLTRIEGVDADKWPVPHVLPVYLNGEELNITERCLVQHIAQAVGRRLSDLATAGVAVPEVSVPAIHDAEDFQVWWSGIQRACTPRVGLLVIIDEFHVLLRELHNAGVLRAVIGGLRALQQKGVFGLLLCGSCTLRTVDRRLADTSMAGEIEREPVGFLSGPETEQVFRRGFQGTVHILGEAVEEIWQLTGGYPNHIHLLGHEVVRRLVEENRRMVTRDLVREVAYRVCASDSTVSGIIKPHDETLSGGIDLLLDLMDPHDEGAIDPGVAERLSAEEREQVDRYLDLGLLRDEGNRWTWANQLMLIWLQKKGERHRRTANRLMGRDPAETVLLDAGFGDLRCFRSGKTCRRVQRDDRPLVAWRFLVDGTPVPAEELDLLHDRFDEYRLSPVPPGFPDYRGRVGQWLLFSYVPGISLQDRLVMQPDRPEEPERAAGWIAGACDVLSRVAELWALTHGDLRPANIVIFDGEVSVVGWGYGGFGDRPSPLVPRDRGYLSPQYLRRIADDTGGATPSDDVFALGVILYQFLHPDGTLPYQDGLHDADRSAAPPVPAVVQADPDLLSCLDRALALRDEDRYPSPRQFAAALRDALPQLREPADMVDREAGQPGVTNLNNVTINNVENFSQEGQRMINDRSIRVAGSIDNSVVGHGNRVRDSLNRVRQSDANEEVKQLLSELAQQVEQLTGRLEPAAADALVRDFDAFGAEASSPEPRAGTLARIGADLVQTASKMSDVATPLIDLVQRVVGLF